MGIALLTMPFEVVVNVSQHRDLLAQGSTQMLHGLFHELRTILKSVHLVLDCEDLKLPGQKSALEHLQLIRLASSTLLRHFCSIRAAHPTTRT
jgi:hypothetical protein